MLIAIFEPTSGRGIWWSSVEARLGLEGRSYRCESFGEVGRREHLPSHKNQEPDYEAESSLSEIKCQFCCISHLSGPQGT